MYPRALLRLGDVVADREVRPADRCATNLAGVPDVPDPADGHVAGRSWVALAAAVAGVVLSWVLLMPPGSGPDEQSHLTRAGAVVRGELDDAGTFLLPDDYRLPEPGCYAFQPAVPVTCAALPERTGDDVLLVSSAGEYAVWGHLVVGLPTLLPVLEPVWWARLAGGALAAAAVVAALSVAGRRAHGLVGASFLFALTPMAWSTFGTVNPSSLATAGAVALWAGLTAPPSRRVDWIAAVGWAMLALPRRDGLIWAFLALAVALAATDRSALAWWRALGLGPRVVMGLSTAAAIAYGATSGSRSSQMVVLAPLIVVGGEALAVAMRRAPDRVARLAVAVTAAVVVAIATLALLTRRPGGWSTDIALAVVGQTDDNLVEAIGVLGWLDTPVPWVVVFAWLALLGLLVAPALTGELRRLAAPVVLLVATAASSWVFELFNGGATGTYWQGRYSLPPLIGVPVLLAIAVERDADRSAVVLRLGRRVATTLVVGAAVIVNVAAWAAARRFGVGTTGSHLPWRWDTPLQPVPPVLVLALLAVSSAALVHLWWRSQHPSPTDP